MAQAFLGTAKIRTLFRVLLLQMDSYQQLPHEVSVKTDSNCMHEPFGKLSVLS